MALFNATKSTRIMEIKKSTYFCDPVGMRQVVHVLEHRLVGVDRVEEGPEALQVLHHKIHLWLLLLLRIGVTTSSATEPGFETYLVQARLKTSVFDENFY